MMTAVCVFLPVAVGIAIGEGIAKRYPRQTDKLLNKISGQYNHERSNRQ